MSVDSCGRIVRMVTSLGDYSQTQADWDLRCHACKDGTEHTQAYHDLACAMQEEANRRTLYRIITGKEA